MRIYTRSGDGGKTGLGDGSRVGKDEIRVEAYGSIDELTSCLGVLRAEGLDSDTDRRLLEIQQDLFELGADLARPGSRKAEAWLEQRVAELETWLDRLSAEVPELRAFILPGGTREAALCHLARSVARRAERACWACQRQQSLGGKQPLGKQALIYLNRLSDLLFQLARVQNRRRGVQDLIWQPRQK